MSRYVGTAILCSGILLGGVSAAGADSPGPAHWLYDRSATAKQEIGQFFAGFTFGADVQHLPRFAAPVVLANPATVPFLSSSFSQNVLGYQPGGEVGFVFRDGTFPAWAGSRVRTTLFGSAYFAENKQGATTAMPSDVTVLAAHVNGTLAAGGLGGVGTFSFEETLKLQREHYRIGLKAESDIALTPDVSLTPSIGFFGGRQHDVYEYNGRGRSPAFPTLDAVAVSLHERLRTTEYGGFVGARLTWQFRPGWALDFGGTAGAVALSSRLDAASCVTPSLLTAGASACPPTFAATAASATASNSAIGFRGTASIGLTADLRVALVSLGGTMRYDSRIPGVENAPGFALGATSAPPVKIKYAGGFAYGGHLNIRIILN